MTSKGISIPLIVTVSVIIAVIIGSCAYYLSTRVVEPSEEPFYVGCVTALSGPYAAVGAEQVRGARFAVDMINKEGGVLGRPVELIVRDDETLPDVAVLKATELIEHKDMLFLTGSTSDATILGIKTTCAREGFPYSHMIGASEESRGERFSKYFFNGLVGCDHINHVELKYLITDELVPKKFVLMLPDYLWGDAMGRAATVAIEDWGGYVEKVIITPFGLTDYSSFVMEALAVESPASIYLAQFGDDQFLLIKELYMQKAQERGYEIINAWTESAIYMAWEPEEIEGTWSCVYHYIGFEDQISKEFQTEYFNMFGMFSGWYSTLQVVYTYYPLKAMNETGSTDFEVWGEWLIDRELSGVIDSIPKKYRSCDQVLQKPVHVLRGKSPAEMVDIFTDIPGDQSDWDRFEIVYIPTIDELSSICSPELALDGALVGDPRIGYPEAKE